MKTYVLENLMNRPFVENRPVIAITPRCLKVDGFLISHDKKNAIIQRADGKRNFSCSIEDVHPR